MGAAAVLAAEAPAKAAEINSVSSSSVGSRRGLRGILLSSSSPADEEI